MMARFEPLEIRCDAVFFPVAIACRLGAARAIDFFRRIFARFRSLAGTLGTPCLGFGERAFGFRGEWRLRRRRLIGWHRS